MFFHPLFAQNQAIFSSVSKFDSYTDVFAQKKRKRDSWIHFTFPLSFYARRMPAMAICSIPIAIDAR